ncbi:hypothetical protein Pla175_01470 [Pirellulimonas nuda]|uniref:Uncharacterized protein n=1 Tax=Pirellulimonas nuda TaxID=2528009 RepID=A0A518D5P9_9BACT|nr:hypothetical protein [Pirellulimonas nuda]QDU86795.1 hypothetical protein Pla175_01470 [Pirellulimonas nuda]
MDPTIEKARCTECDAEILLSTTMETGGLCMPCFKQMERVTSERQYSDSLAVSAHFHPGFADDLTSWETSVYLDGSVQQDINWYTPHHRRKRELRTTTITDSQVDEIVNAIRGIDLNGLAAIPFCVDDVEIVSITSPKLNIDVRTSPYTFEYFARTEKLPDGAINGILSFMHAWKTIDGLSPYTTSEHAK